MTPLHLSTFDGHFGIVKLLLERGADAHAMNNEGQTPLELSLQRGYPEVTDLLRKHGAGRARFDESFLTLILSLIGVRIYHSQETSWI